MSDAPKITREDLAKLLQIKIEKQLAFEAAARASKECSGPDVYKRVDLDLLLNAALKASAAADRTYENGIIQFVKQEAE